MQLWLVNKQGLKMHAWTRVLSIFASMVIDHTHFVLLTLGLLARNSEWNSWYATAIIRKQYKLFVNNYMLNKNTLCVKKVQSSIANRYV